AGGQPDRTHQQPPLSRYLPDKILTRLDHVDRIVEQWHAERPDLDVAPLALVGRLVRVSHLLNERLGAELAEFDLQPGWFDLLAARDARGGDKDAAGNPSAARHPGAAGDRRGSGDDSVRRRDAQRGQAGEAVQLVSSALLIG